MAGNVQEKIGEGLLRIKAITSEQLADVLERQKNGDKRLFGEIAVELGYLKFDALISYLQSVK